MVGNADGVALALLKIISLFEKKREREKKTSQLFYPFDPSTIRKNDRLIVKAIVSIFRRP